MGVRVRFHPAKNLLTNTPLIIKMRLALGIFGLSLAQESKTAESRLFYNEASQSIVGFECTWEDGWCDGWQNVDFSSQPNYVPSKYFDYVVRQGPSASPATGPAHDHTLKTAEGHYLLLEASKKRFLSRAEIMSPPFDISPFPEYCFSMWYLMFGRHTFSLHAYISIPSTRSEREMILKESGSASQTAHHWLYHQVTINRPPNWDGRMVNITIAGVRGLSYQADIGIDDIKFVPGKCPSSPPPDATVPATTTIATTTRATGTTTTTTTTIMNPMITREYNPFYQLKVEKCEVKDIKGQIIFESYISNTHMCCGDAIKSRLNGSKCCNGQQYFARKQDCCNDEIILLSEHVCCGGKKVITEAGKVCCGGETRAITPGEGCCGGNEFFNKESQGCCIDQVYDKNTQYCCGGSLIDLTDERALCCGKGWKGNKYYRGRESCCNGNLYSTVLYGCCGEQYVYDKKWESCNSTVADDPRVSKKQGFGWKRPSHKAGQYMFLYRRKRRNADIKGLSHPEAMAIYREQRSMFVTPNNPLKLP